jgi:hypothetical protein
VRALTGVVCVAVATGVQTHARACVATRGESDSATDTTRWGVTLKPQDIIPSYTLLVGWMAVRYARVRVGKPKIAIRACPYVRKSQNRH